MLIIAGTVPDNEFPLTSGTLSRFGDDLVIEGRRFSCTQGTGAMASAALAVTSYLGMDSPLAVLAGDTGQGQGSRELYEYLIENVPELQPDVLALHYWLPDREQTRRLCDAVKKMKKKPVLIADAASMYSAKLAGLAPFFDIFTPDAAETAFLADADAPHPAYVKFMMYNNMDRTEEVIHIAYRLGNASQLMLVKGKTDYIVVNDNIVATVNEPDIPAMEAIGGTGDTITGMVAAFCSAGLKPREAALLAARANRAAGLAARVTPATRVKEIITALPGIFQEKFVLLDRSLHYWRERMIEVDARGLSCPIPVVKTIKAMEEHPQDVLQVLVDNGTARENILRLGTNRDYTVSVQEIAGEWHLKLTPPA